MLNNRRETLIKEIKGEVQKLILPIGVSQGMSIAVGNECDAWIMHQGTDGNGHDLTDNTLYDLASITKLFVAIIYMKLVETGKVNLSKSVGEYSTRFKNISSLKLEDILAYKVKLYTVKRIDECVNYEEAFDNFLNVEGQACDIQSYSDIPSMVLAELLVEITGETFAVWIEKVFDIPLGLDELCWNYSNIENKKCISYKNEKWLIENKLILKENPVGIVNDPKSRILTNGNNRLCGNAGLFCSTKDIVKIVQALLAEKIISKRSMLALAEGSGWSARGVNQSFGFFCYRKYDDKRQSEVPLILSRCAIAVSGFTGCYLMIDVLNGIYVYIGGNRLNDCISRNQSQISEENGYIFYDNKIYRSSVNYVYQRDRLRDVLCELALEHYAYKDESIN